MSRVLRFERVVELSELIKHKRFGYVYRPGFHDRTDPTVIRGQAVAFGEHARIARELNPPMYPTKVFVMIQDKHGNVQSVYRQSLSKVPKGLGKETRRQA